MYNEMMIANLAKKFDGIMLRYTGKPRTSLKSSDIRESKNYRYFQELADIINNFPNIDIDQYMEAQVYWASKSISGNRCNPSWLVTDNAIKRYAKFLKLRNDNNNIAYVDDYKKLVLDSIKQSIMFLTKKMKEYNLSSIEETLRYKRDGALIPESFNWIFNYNITKPFLAIYNKYEPYYESYDDDIKRDLPDPKDLIKMKRYIILNKDLNIFCKEVVNAGN